MGMWDAFESAEKDRRQREEEFAKLQADPCGKIPKKYDRVLFACGLLGFGFHWERMEAVVLECGSTSYRLIFPTPHTPNKDDFRMLWVHQALITDVLGPISSEVIEKLQKEGV